MATPNHSQSAIPPLTAFLRLLRLGIILAATVVVPIAVLIWDGLHDDLQHADVAVVLGNKVELDGTPSPRLKARLDRAADLYKAGWFKAIIVSGGTGIEGFDEAAVMKSYLVANNIPVAAIVEDNRGLTTFATAENTARILRQKGWKSVVVISQYFHISRSVLAMKRCGVAEVRAAHADFFELRDLYSIPREVIGFARYFFKSPAVILCAGRASA